MTNYESFYKLLNESGCKELKLTFEQLTSILGELPEESKYRSWWSNDSSNDYSKTWCSAGYDVTKVIPDFYVCFTKKLDIKKNIDNKPPLESIPVSSVKETASEKKDNTENIDKKEKIESNKNTVESIRALHNSPTCTTKTDNSNSIRIAGGIILALDLFICIPVLLSDSIDFNSFIAVCVIGTLFLIISLTMLLAGNPFIGGYRSYSGGYYDNSMYNEMKAHNARMQQMSMENESRRIQEEYNRISRETRQSLADQVDTRITNIFRNPWEGIL